MSITLLRKTAGGYRPAAAPDKIYKVVKAKPQPIARSRSTQGNMNGLAQGQSSSLALASGAVDAGSGMVIGLIQAINIVVTELSAITENVGTLIVNEGGSISSGETAFGTGVGFWLGTDASGNPQFSIIDQFNNYIIFDGSSANPLAINSTGVINVLSSKQTDDQGWSQTSVFGSITGLPNTIAGYGITDAQATLPTTSGKRWSFFSDNGGTIYAAPEYDTNVNFAAATIADDSEAVNISPGKVWAGANLGIPNPGQAVNIKGTISGQIVFVSGTPAAEDLVCQYSSDGGVTWNSGQIVQASINSTTIVIPIYAEVEAFGVLPTGDVLVRALIGNSGASLATVNYERGTLTLELYPVANFYVLAPLSASVPSTAAMSCSATYPTTTCTATGQVTVVGLQGKSPFSYAWAKVSGTGSIASGSTSQTVTLTDTETCANPAATHNTTVKCVVTDSQSYTSTAGTRTGGTATITIGAHFIPIGATVTLSGFTPTAFNGTFVVTGVSATTISFVLSGTTPVTVQGTVGSVNVTTGNCVMTGTFTLTYAPITGSIAATSGSCTATPCGTNCTSTTAKAKAIANGGNRSYTYAWSVTSGTASIASGGSSQTCTFTQTAPTSNSTPNLSSGVQCSVNDTVGTGAVILTGTVINGFFC